MSPATSSIGTDQLRTSWSVAAAPPKKLEDMEWKITFISALDKIEAQGKALEAADRLIEAQQQTITELEKKDKLSQEEIAALKATVALKDEVIEALKKKDSLSAERIKELEYKLRESLTKRKKSFFAGGLSGIGLIALLAALM